jgi:hypothetical protein
MWETWHEMCNITKPVYSICRAAERQMLNYSQNATRSAPQYHALSQQCRTPKENKNVRLQSRLSGRGFSARGSIFFANAPAPLLPPSPLSRYRVLTIFTRFGGAAVDSGSAFGGGFSPVSLSLSIQINARNVSIQTYSEA